MHRSTILLVSLAMLAFLATTAIPTAAAGGDPTIIDLQPETTSMMTFKASYRSFPVVEEKPERVKAAPEGVTKWLVFPWGEGEAIIGVGEESFWPDQDGDGDLEEEAPIAIAAHAATNVELDLKIGGDIVRTKLEVKARSGGFRLTNLTRMSGTAKLGDREVAVSLTDYLVNGRYTDYRTTKTAEYWLCDHMHIDVDGDGDFKRRIPPWGEDYCLARRFVFADALYTCEVLDRGARVRIAPVNEPLVTVKVNTPDFIIRLVSDELGNCSISGKEGSARLPAGRYLLDACEYSVGEARVRGLFWQEDGERWFEVKEGCELTVAGDLRYDLTTKRLANGDLSFVSISYGPLGDRVMVYPDRGVYENIRPLLTVETLAGEILYDLRQRYC